MTDPHPPQQESHAGGGYEKSDLAAKPVAVFAVVLTAVVAGVLVVILWMLDFFAARLPVPPPGVAAPSSAIRSGPPEPRLQVDGMRNLRAMRAEEDRLLTSYGWVNREAKTVRIPIDRAMELLVERGLPGSPEAKPAPAAKPARGRR